MRVMPVVSVFAIAFAAGCTNIPPGGTPEVRRSGGDPLAGHVAVAPVSSIALASDEVAHGWKPDEVFVASSADVDLQRGIAAALDGTGAYVEPARLAASDDLAEAWTNRDDLLVSVSLSDVRIDFKTNGWYGPNVVNFCLWVVTAWTVAKEDYTLAFDAHIRARSGDTGAPLIDDEVVKVSVTGSFDEFDRGFQLLGPLGADNKPENWRLVATRLLPAARKQLAEKVAGAVDAALEKQRRAATPASKTLVLAVGATRYADANRLPRLAYASDDAQAVAAAFVSEGISLSHHTLVLADDRATGDAVRRAIGEFLALRARDGDNVVFHFAGYGTRDARGSPVLLLTDSDGKSKGELPLPELAALLGRTRGKKLVLLDTSFDGGVRSVGGGAAPAGGDLERAFAAADDVRVIAAAEPGQSAFATDRARHGVFTNALVSGLRGRADENRDGRIAAGELFIHVHDRVVAEVAHRGELQAPRQTGTGQLSFEPRRAR